MTLRYDEIALAIKSAHCSHCNADPGEYCVMLRDTPSPVSSNDMVHTVRLNAWRAQGGSTGNLRDDVRAFHEKFGHAIGKVPAVPDVDVLAFRLRLIAEGFCELLAACGVMNYDVRVKIMQAIDQMVGRARQSETNYRQALTHLPDIIDALADLDYVVEGTRLVCGVDGAPIAAEVHRANMSKEAVGDLKKPTKPEGWKPPDIEGELIKQGWKP